MPNGSKTAVSDRCLRLSDVAIRPTRSLSLNEVRFMSSERMVGPTGSYIFDNTSRRVSLKWLFPSFVWVCDPPI